MNPDSLRDFVDAAATIVNKRLVHVLLTQHHLMTHMKALKSYMLLGQGDFLQTLIDSLNPEPDATAVRGPRGGAGRMLGRMESHLGMPGGEVRVISTICSRFFC